ncbi:MAG: hypothetical protein AAB403_16365 [Planctomycetota bacterium]
MFRSALVLFTTLLTVPCWGALNHNQNSVVALSKTYGFLFGQEYSLRRIEATYPDLRIQVQLARLEFDTTFPGVKENLEAELTSAIGSTNFDKVRAQTESGVRGLLDQQAMTPTLAQQFVGQVRARAKGNEMEAEVLNYLLAVQYAQDPVGEFLAGFRQRFRTDGTGKSQGVRLNLQVPRSWVAQEGERPHIVRKWASEGGTGLSYIMLDIRDAQGYSPTAREIEQFVRSGEAREMFSEFGQVLDIGSFSVEGRTGYWSELAMTQERAGFRLYLRGLMYQLFLSGRAIGIICMAGAKEGENQKADTAALLVKPVCQQVINSLVLEQVY